MIEIHAPGDPAVSAIQSNEGRYYFSALADTVLRQFGLLPVVPAEDGEWGAIALPGVRLRGTAATDQRLGVLFEGPLGPEQLSMLDLAAETRLEEELILVENGAPAGVHPVSVYHPAYLLRSIPRQPGEPFGEPFLYEPDDPLLAERRIKYQCFKEPGPEWTVLLRARDSSGTGSVPVVLTDGRCVVCGLPLFDLLGSSMYVPAFPAGFYASAHASPQPYLQQLLLSFLQAIHEAVKATPLQLGLWPNDRRWALSIRHDYDRLITDLQLNSLLAFYKKRKLKCTWFALCSRLPVAQLDRLQCDGHEVALHSEAQDHSAFAEELLQLRQRGFSAVGATAHGGIGSLGFVGLTQYQWADELNLRHGEVLGTSAFQPYPALLSGGGRLSRSKVTLTATHLSLETSTRATADFDTEHLRSAAHRRRSLGGHFNLMNHPDLARDALTRLLSELPIEDAWCATFSDVARWVSSTRYSARASRVNDTEIRICFPQALAGPLFVQQGAAINPEEAGWSCRERRVVLLPTGFAGAVTLRRRGDGSFSFLKSD